MDGTSSAKKTYLCVKDVLSFSPVPSQSLTVSESQSLGSWEGTDENPEVHGSKASCGARKQGSAQRMTEMCPKDTPKVLPLG